VGCLARVLIFLQANHHSAFWGKKLTINGRKGEARERAAAVVQIMCEYLTVTSCSHVHLYSYQHSSIVVAYKSARNTVESALLVALAASLLLLAVLLVCYCCIDIDAPEP
jgi:hypothetical protein